MSNANDFVIENGVLKKYIGLESKIVIPEGVQGIAIEAFCGCSHLESITIPQGVTSIGWTAFKNCSSLHTVEMPDTVKSIGWYAFENCTSLKSLCIPEGVTDIEPNTFRGCSSLHAVSIPSSVIRIKSNAFCDCSALKSVALPAKLLHIGDMAFKGCTSLYDISIPISMTEIGSAVFEGTPWLNEQGEAVILQDRFVKYQGTGKDYSIPSKVHCICGSAFKDCDSLESIVVSNSVTEIGESAFENCRHLISITLSKSITDIGSKAFYGCDHLEKIIIPSGVTRVRDYAFYFCKNLASVEISDSVTEIGERTFYGCTNLQKIIVSGLNLKMQVFGKKDSVLAKLPGLYCVQAPGANVDDCEAWLKPMLLSGFLDHPALYAENKAAQYIKYMSGQKKRLLTDAVSKNQLFLFAAYDQHQIKIPPALRDELIELATKEEKTEILAWLLDYKNRTADLKKESKTKERTFEQQLTNPYMPKLLKTEWNWSKLEDGTMQIDKYKGSDAAVVIPPFVGDVPVTSVGGCAFVKETRSSWNANTTTESIAIPESITNISSFAFCGCTKLKEIHLPSQVSRIGYGTFEGCSSLESIDIPTGVTGIGYNAFRFTPWEKEQGDMVILNGILVRYQGSNADVVIPGHVTTIGEKAFEGCKNLKSVEIPDSVKYIGPNAFEGCGKLKSVKLPKEITCIEVGVFFGCKSLRSVEIPDGVISIERIAFRDCTNLKKIELPDSVTNVHFTAFEGCKNLKSISLPENVELEAKWMPENTEIIRRAAKN